MKRKSLLFALLLAIGLPWAANAQNTITLTGNLTQTIAAETSYNFYDSGGPNSDYASSQNYTATFTCVGTITINFSQFVTESSSGCSDWDHMHIYDGDASTGTLLARGQTGCSSATLTTGTNYVASSGTMTVVWKSDGSSVAAGWSATITGGAAPSCPRPTITDVITDTDQVSLRWTKDGDVTQWQVECSQNADFTNATPFEINNGLPVKIIDDLTPATTYYVRVRSYCGGTDYSSWSTTSFTTECEAVTAFPWSENFENYATGNFSDPCWVNEHISGNGAKVFQVSTSYNQTGSTHTLQLPDMTSGTMTKLRLPKMTLTTGDSYIFSIDVYRNTSGTSYTSEGVRVYASTDGEIEGATELGFLYRNCGQTDGGVVTAEASTGWYTYEFSIPFTGTCYIVLRGESQYGSATYMDNFKVKKELPCVKPADPTFVSSTTTSATLRWTNGAEGQTAWQIAYSTDPAFDPNNVTPVDVTSNPGTINGLTAATNYYAYVRANCGTLGYSEWSTTYCQFATACDAITNFPWNDNFESYSTGDFSAPCWVNERIQDGTGTSGSLSIFKITTYSYTGNSTKLLQLPDMKAGTLTKLVLPEMTLPGNDYQFVLDVYRNSNNKPTEGIRVYVSTNGELAGATELAFISRDYTVSDGGLIPAETESNWYTYQLPLGISGTCYIILQGESQYGSSTYMDNFFVEQIPTCPKPTSLAVTSGSVNAHSATITWVEEGEATTWIVEFANNANFENYLNETVENEPTYTFHGLAPETTYYVRVKAHCGDGDESVYCNNIVNFTTTPACMAPSSLTCSAFTATTATLSWTESGESTAWQICLNNDEEHLTDIDTDDVTINEGVVTYQLGDLTSATAYTAKVCGICNNEPTDWSNVASFTTLQVAVNLPYSNDFESGNDWLLVNGNLTNAWAYGTATSNGEGTHALYISNDGGTTNAYTLNSAAMVYATKLFNFEAGTYVFSYDWKANGEASSSSYYYDYLRVALVPSSVTLTAGTSAPVVPSGSSFFNNLPTGWIALDGGSQLQGITTWQSFTSNEIEVAAGTYVMVFAWRDDTSGGSQPPAAIDNVSIEKITCTTPANLTINENSITNNSVEFSWTETGEATAWQICLNGDESNLTDIDTDDVTINEGVVTYQLTDLTSETAYTVKVRANCDADNQSGWSNEASFTTKSNCATPDGLNVTELTDNSAKLNWNGVQESYNVRYREVITPDVNFNVTYDFEDGMQGWTFSDEDGDGNCWAISSSSPHGGSQCVRATYNFNDVPLNWLISPEIPLGGTLSFYAKRYSSGTGEQFQVFVSSTGTDISNFTPITDVIDATTTYELYEYSLSNYSGNGYVAIKHTAEVNQWYLDVDDITITNITQGEYGAWNTSNTNVTSGLTINGLTPLTMYEWQVQGINAGCDGGVTDWSEAATFTTPITKHIIGYASDEAGSNGNNYYLIASPLADAVDPTTVGMITDDFGANVPTPEDCTYDFFAFDQDQELEWVNYRGNAFNMVNGKGYLYASKEGTTITFIGMPYSGEGIVTLDRTDDDEADFQGWNLVGNPFAEEAYVDRPFYVMDANGAEIIAETNVTRAIQPMEGIFVTAEQDGETMTFTTEAPGAKANLVLNITQGRSNTIDRAIISVGQGRTLPKFMLNPGNTKLYIPQNGEDYAVVRSRISDEIPVSFEPAENGLYTISVDVRNMNLRSLLLKDKVRNVTIDLLRTPSYQFKARTEDRADRFMLSFRTSTSIYKEKVVKGANSEDFGFFSYGNWVIDNEGEATLQVIDLNGRVLSTENIYGSTSIQVDAVPGVYMLRLINGDNVKVQKIVVE